MSSSKETLETASRKRKFDDEDSNDERRSKVPKIEVSSDLLRLADEVLMEILIKLDGESLHTLGGSCEKLKQIVQDKKLWNSAEFTARELDIFEILKRLKHLKVTTKKLKLMGNCTSENVGKRPMPNRQTFKEIVKRVTERSPLIQHLSFSKICFDWTKDFSISKFPANLRSLIFHNCVMPKNKNRRMMRTFTGIVERMPELEEIRIEYCNFFESNDVMPFSKLQGLKTMSLRGCLKMKNCVPYLSLACRFGFPALEHLDLRETNISDGEVQCLNAIKTLKELLLERPEADPVQSDSDDDEFELFFRGSRARLAERTRRNAVDSLPDVQPAVQVPQNGQATGGSANGQIVQEPQPSTSRNIPGPSSPDQSPSQPARKGNDKDEASPSSSTYVDEPQSSPESYSDSVSSPSSAPEDSPMRTIVIRANINAEPYPEQQNEPRIQVIFGGDVPHARRFLQGSLRTPRFETTSVSDRGMLGFGVPRPNIMGNLVFFGNQPADPNTYIERITLRNFANISDITMAHLENNAPRLTFLDVTGCPQITRECVERFKVARTECEVKSNYDFEE